VGFYVSCEQIHVLLSPSLQSIRQWVDIVLSTNGIHILVDVVIVDGTQVEWVLCVVSSHGVIEKVLTQIKGHYCGEHSMNVFSCYKGLWLFAPIRPPLF
jgi:hypothetical protein